MTCLRSEALVVFSMTGVAVVTAAAAVVVVTDEEEVGAVAGQLVLTVAVGISVQSRDLRGSTPTSKWMMSKPTSCKMSAVWTELTVRRPTYDA